MKNILHIISSPRGSQSVSIKLGKAIEEKLLTEYPGSTVKEINLAANPFPHIGEALINATRGGKADDTGILELSDAAVQDLQDADILIIGVPLYNFGIPSSLKSWLDAIIRPGIAFRYGPNGPEGLIKGKKVYLAMASGGVYSEGPMKDRDFAAPYLETVLGFIGITDVTVIRAEGIGIPDLRDFALQKAIDTVVV